MEPLISIPLQKPWYSDPNWWLVLAAYITILGAILGVIIKYWNKIKTFFVRARLRHFPVHFNIALSFKASSDSLSKTYVTEVKKQLINLIDRYNLSKEIKIRDFEDIVQFKNADEAQMFCVKKNLDLIIWGEYSNADLKDQSGHNCSEIALKFTYLHPEGSKGNLGKMIALEIQTIAALKSYSKIIDSSLEDIKIIGENIFDVSTYILGLTLKLFGKINQSILILESVLHRATNKNDVFSNGIRFHLINDYDLFVTESYWQNDYKRGLFFAQKILNIDCNNFFGLANAAVFAYKLGNTAEAEMRISQLEKTYPNDPLTWIDVAFFRILKKDYKGAYKMYKKIINTTYLDSFNVIDVIDFLESQYDNDQGEPAFIYASAALNYYFADKSRAKNHLKKFLQLANNQKYRKMCQHAKRIVLEFDKPLMS